MGNWIVLALVMGAICLLFAYFETSLKFLTDNVHRKLMVHIWMICAIIAFIIAGVLMFI